MANEDNVSSNREMLAEIEEEERQIYQEEVSQREVLYNDVSIDADGISVLPSELDWRYDEILDTRFMELREILGQLLFRFPDCKCVGVTYDGIRYEWTPETKWVEI